MKISKREMYWAIVRIVLGFTLLWPFFDKLLGLGYSTTAQAAWINGGSPTTGFLKSLSGPFHFLFTPFVGLGIIDWLFMGALLIIGLCLILGIFVKQASLAGIVLFFLMWLALFPSKTNPIIDDHIIYILVLVGVIIYNSKPAFSINGLLNNRSGS